MSYNIGVGKRAPTRGKARRALGICDRCSFVCRWEDMVQDIYNPGVYTCGDTRCRDTVDTIRGLQDIVHPDTSFLLPFVRPDTEVE